MIRFSDRGEDAELAMNFQRGMPAEGPSPRRAGANRARGRLWSATIGSIYAGDEPRFVLAVGVEHHDHVGATLRRLEVAGLLVASVADLMGMPDHVDLELAGQVDGLVGRGVIDQDHLVDRVPGISSKVAFRGGGGLPGRRDHDDLRTAGFLGCFFRHGDPRREMVPDRRQATSIRSADQRHRGREHAGGDQQALDRIEGPPRLFAAQRLVEVEPPGSIATKPSSQPIGFWPPRVREVAVTSSPFASIPAVSEAVVRWTRCLEQVECGSSGRRRTGPQGWKGRAPPRGDRRA